ncbi:MAG: glycosyltransferase family 4 protein [Candidatus Neomarinimicrobiota bacterium]|nr:glycosyltransferase family 4 protein [Candidatus Neomarinimicrobiota bacterium]
MKILFFTDNFFPETNAPAKRTYEHCLEWSKNNDVTVITCVPNFPKGKVFDGYKNKIYQSSFEGKILIKRVWSFITPNEGFFLRVLDYCSFMISSLLCGLFSKKPDVLIATSPQFFTLISAYLTSLIKNIPLVIEIRDMWPQSIVTVGAMKKDSFIIKILEYLAKFLYKKATLIVCVTNSFKNDMVKMGINSNKIEVITNGFNLNNIISPSDNIIDVEKKYGLDKNKKYISFIGTVGMAHGLEIILETAQKIDNQSVNFLIIGDGAKKQYLIKQCTNLGINNIHFIDNLSWKEIVNINQLISAHIVHLKKDKEFTKVIPSKIFESMALRKPIFMGVEGEARELLNIANCSFNFPPEDSDKLKHLIDKNIGDTHYLNELGMNGYNFLINNYSRKILSKKMIEFIKTKI